MSAITPVLPQSPGVAVRPDAPAPALRAPPAARVETARAVLPPDAARKAADLRFVDREGRPVGPPPAFQVSVLEARRLAALHPPPPPDGAGGSPFAALAPAAAPDQVDLKV